MWYTSAVLKTVGTCNKRLGIVLSLLRNKKELRLVITMRYRKKPRHVTADRGGDQPHYASIVQGIEQFTSNEWVVGLNPTGGTMDTGHTAFYVNWMLWREIP